MSHVEIMSSCPLYWYSGIPNSQRFFLHIFIVLKLRSTPFLSDVSSICWSKWLVADLPPSPFPGSCQRQWCLAPVGTQSHLVWNDQNSLLRVILPNVMSEFLITPGLLIIEGYHWSSEWHHYCQESPKPEILLLGLTSNLNCCFMLILIIHYDSSQWSHIND